MQSDGKTESVSPGELAEEGPWYATCESGHPIWQGPSRSEYDAAQGDATAHDNAVHGGTPTAVVLN